MQSSVSPAKSLVWRAIIIAIRVLIPLFVIVALLAPEYIRVVGYPLAIMTSIMLLYRPKTRRYYPRRR